MSAITVPTRWMEKRSVKATSNPWTVSGENSSHSPQTGIHTLVSLFKGNKEKPLEQFSGKLLDKWGNKADSTVDWFVRP